MSLNKPGIDTFVSNHLPQFIKEDHDRFVKFIEAYYSFMESSGQVLYDGNKLKDYQDIDYLDGNKSNPKSIVYTEQFFREYLSDIPRNILVNKPLLLKHIKQFYRSKGTEKSFKFLFRILFDVNVELYYPRVDVLKASDGKWIQTKYLKISNINYPQNISLVDCLDMLKTTEIKGDISNCVARIEHILILREINGYKLILNNSSITGKFKPDETITFGKNNECSMKNISENGIVEDGPGEGYYLNQDGHISSDKYIHDGEFYQQFSYVTYSELSNNYYEDSLKKLIHPIGFKQFSGVRVQSNIDAKLDIDTTSYRIEILSHISNNSIKKITNDVKLHHQSITNVLGSTNNSILRDKFNYKPFTKYDANLEFMDSNNQNYFGENILNAKALTPVSVFAEIKPKDLETNRFQKTNIGIDSVVITYNSGDADVFCIESGECFFDFGLIVDS